MTIQLISYINWESGNEEIAGRLPDGRIITNQESGWRLGEIVELSLYTQEERGLPLASPLFVEW
jgi:hypothetical protein